MIAQLSQERIARIKDEYELTVLPVSYAGREGSN